MPPRAVFLFARSHVGTLVTNGVEYIFAGAAVPRRAARARRRRSATRTKRRTARHGRPCIDSRIDAAAGGEQTRRPGFRVTREAVEVARAQVAPQKSVRGCRGRTPLAIVQPTADVRRRRPAGAAAQLLTGGAPPAPIDTPAPPPTPASSGEGAPKKSVRTIGEHASEADAITTAAAARTNADESLFKFHPILRPTTRSASRTISKTRIARASERRHADRIEPIAKARGSAISRRKRPPRPNARTRGAARRF